MFVMKRNIIIQKHIFLLKLMKYNHMNITYQRNCYVHAGKVRRPDPAALAVAADDKRKNAQMRDSIYLQYFFKNYQG